MFHERLKTILASMVLIGLLVFSYVTNEKKNSYDPFVQPLQSPKGIVNLNSLKEGKVLLMYFGFLSCPDACPTTLNTMSQAFKELSSNDLAKINFLFIDLDPEKDTLKKLEDYTSYFHSKIQPVTLKIQELDLFTRYFGISYKKIPLDSAMGYTIDHSTDVLILSPDGKIIDIVPHGSPKVVVIDKILKALTSTIKKDIK